MRVNVSLDDAGIQLALSDDRTLDVPGQTGNHDEQPDEPSATDMASSEQATPIATAEAF